MKTAELLKRPTEDDWRHCFKEWQRRTEQCVDVEGSYTLKEIIIKL